MTSADLSVIHGLSDCLQSSAGANEAERRLQSAVVDTLSESGLFTLLLPPSVGGDERTAMNALSQIAHAAYHDGAAGWCSMISSTTSLLAAFLDPAVARATFGSAKAVGGVFAPKGSGVWDGDDLVVSGRWQWGSGLQHCDWAVCGVVDDAGHRHTAVVATAELDIIDTWYTVGLRGTGSNDFALNGARVAKDHLISQTKPIAMCDDAVASLPNFSMLGAGVAAVSLGIACRSIDEFTVLAKEHRPQFSTRLIAEHHAAQAAVAEAIVEVRAFGEHLMSAVADVWHTIVAGERCEVGQRVAIRGAAARLVTAGADVATTMFRLGGGAAVYEDSLLGRCLRDSQVVPQHLMVAPKLFETLGRHALDQPLDAGMI